MFQLTENPLISAVMPTRGRAAMAAKSLECFRAQTWANKELIILDDVNDPSFAEPPAGVHYERHPSRSIPTKRNMLCDMAAGEVIMSLDSDDWSDPERMATQLNLMREAAKHVAVFQSLLFWDYTQQQAWRYEGPFNYGPGSTHMFTKAWWTGHRFQEHFVDGEDQAFVSAAFKYSQLLAAPGNKMMVGTTHAGNTSKRHYGIYWKKVRTTEIPTKFFESFGMTQ